MIDSQRKPLVEEADRQQLVIDRTNKLKGAIGQNTDQMDDSAKLQTAFALATGDLTKEDFEAQESIKALLEAQKEHKASNEQVLTTVIAMGQGIADSTDAFKIAGEAGDKYAKETSEVEGTVDAAQKKVSEMNTKLANTPKGTKIDVKAIVFGMEDLDHLKQAVSDLHDRHITITASVVTSGGLPTGGGGSSGGETKHTCPPGSYWDEASQSCKEYRGGTKYGGSKTTSTTDSAYKGYGGTLINVPIRINLFETDPRKVTILMTRHLNTWIRAQAFRTSVGMR